MLQRVALQSDVNTANSARPGILKLCFTHTSYRTEGFKTCPVCDRRRLCLVVFRIHIGRPHCQTTDCSLFLHTNSSSRGQYTRTTYSFCEYNYYNECDSVAVWPPTCQRVLHYAATGGSPCFWSSPLCIVAPPVPLTGSTPNGTLAEPEHTL